MPSWQGNSARDPGALLLEVPYANRLAAKELGAEFDWDLKKWFMPAGRAYKEARVAAWLPENAARRKRNPNEVIANHPGFVFLTAWQPDLREPQGAVWDADFPGYGAWCIPPHLAADLSPWRAHLPAGVQAGGADAAAADDDVAAVVMPENGLPPNTMRWVYYKDGAAVMRRKRRWAVCRKQNKLPFVEMLTQGEYNRRVDAAEWPEYKHAYEVDPRPEWLGGNGYTMPDIIIDRRQQKKQFGADQQHKWDFYENPDDVERKKGQYRDQDEMVVPAPPAQNAGEHAGILEHVQGAVAQLQQALQQVGQQAADAQQPEGNGEDDAVAEQLAAGLAAVAGLALQHAGAVQKPDKMLPAPLTPILLPPMQQQQALPAVAAAPLTPKAAVKQEGPAESPGRQANKQQNAQRRKRVREAEPADGAGHRRRSARLRALLAD